MAERARPPAPVTPSVEAGAPARPPLWFLADREAFVRRFALRTLLRPSPFRRGPRPRPLAR